MSTDKVEEELLEYCKEFGYNYGDIFDYCFTNFWLIIAKRKKLSTDLMEKYFHKLDKSYLSYYQPLTEDFMEKHFEDLYVNAMCYKQIFY